MGSLGNSQFESSIAKLSVEGKTGTDAMDVGLIQRKQIGAVIQLSDASKKTPKLFSSLTIRGKTFTNRIMVSPMCMYSCEKQDGAMTDFHLAHYGNLALRGSSLVIIEASAVSPEGRLSPQDAGIWGPEHVAPLKRVADLTHASGSLIGIQIAHGGRKGACYPPYHKFEENGGKLSREWATVVPESEGGFADQIVAPSRIPWKAGFPVPHELTIPEVKNLVQKFADAAKRAVEAGIDVIEVHGAHGYLIHEFLSGNTNKRTDEYGGGLENRLRFVLEIIRAVRQVIPKEMPLFLRVSGTDYNGGDHILSPDPNGWDIQQVIELCRRAVPLGLDVIDISSGANLPGKAGVMSWDFGFQVPLAEEVKKANIDGLVVASVGALHNGKQSEEVLQAGKADLIMIGREFIKNPSFVYTAAKDLGISARWPSQYSWMWPIEN